MTARTDTWLGVGCGVIAGALWGLIFLAPELAGDFSPLQLSAGRYLVYGVLSVLLIAPRWPALRARVGRAEWGALVRLSLLGNTLYYVFIASAVQLGGIAMTTLVIGFLPVAVAVVGSRDPGAVPLRALSPSLAVGVAGISLISWEAWKPGDGPEALGGLFCAFGAMASWSAYAVGNSRWLARLDGVSAHEWNLLTGVVTGAQALLLAIPAFAFGGSGHEGEAWLRFAAVVGSVGILASIIGNAFWNRMSRLLPLTLIGQMILFETLFGLLYGFVWERRPPSLAEAAAIACVIASVSLCVSAHRAGKRG